MTRLIRLITIDGVAVYFHWSLLLLCGLMLAASLPKPAGTLLAISAYLAIVLLHEWGHVIAARRYHCAVYVIELYPLVGLTRFSSPRSYFDACVIAWAGILAQLLVGVPLVLLGLVLGPYSPEVVTAVIGVFGYLSIFIAVINLLPVAPLDGAKAWPLVPMLVARGIGAYLRQRQPSQRRRNKKRVN
jgi:membrane-associated protease RseP (regulator of RpoE activity)